MCVDDKSLGAAGKFLFLFYHEILIKSLSFFLRQKFVACNLLRCLWFELNPIVGNPLQYLPVGKSWYWEKNSLA